MARVLRLGGRGDYAGPMEGAAQASGNTLAIVQLEGKGHRFARCMLASELLLIDQSHEFQALGMHRGMAARRSGGSRVKGGQLKWPHVRRTWRGIWQRSSCLRPVASTV